jgi:hypothetical protein
MGKLKLRSIIYSHSVRDPPIIMFNEFHRQNIPTQVLGFWDGGTANGEGRL